MYEKKQVLFIQGAGEGAYAVDGELVTSLREALGADYMVLYPQMPEEDAGYAAWKARLAQELAALAGMVAVVGHSAGCSVLLRYLSEEGIAQPLAGLFLIAAPYWGVGGWPDDAFPLDERRASKMLQALPIFFYHGRDDDIVPFAHLALHADSFPQATIRAFEECGHQFNNDLSAVAADIRRMTKGHSTPVG